MIWLKANPAIEHTYRTIIAAFRADIDWNGDILVENSLVILPGTRLSLIFDLEGKRVHPDIIEIPAEPEKICDVADKKLLINIFNMLVYIFGKWEAIKGVSVSHSYVRIDMLLNQVLGEIGANAFYSEKGIKFDIEGIGAVFEDVVSLAIQKLEAPDDETREASGESDAYPSGLWHDMQWKMAGVEFKKSQLDKKLAAEKRIGGNFYMIPYVCPDCGGHLHMSVYPNGREFAIDTEEGKVYIARIYTCPDCCKFYTPRPGRLLSEGDVYVLDFEDDKKAAADYAKLTGRKGGRTSNSNLNMYESDYLSRTSGNEENLEDIVNHMDSLDDAALLDLLERMDEGFYPEDEIKRFLAIIEQELEYRKNFERKRSSKLGDLDDFDDFDDLDDLDSLDDVPQNSKFSDEGPEWFKEAYEDGYEKGGETDEKPVDKADMLREALLNYRERELLSDESYNGDEEGPLPKPVTDDKKDADLKTYDALKQEIEGEEKKDVKSGKDGLGGGKLRKVKEEKDKTEKDKIEKVKTKKDKIKKAWEKNDKPDDGGQKKEKPEESISKEEVLTEYGSEDAAIWDDGREKEKSSSKQELEGRRGREEKGTGAKLDEARSRRAIEKKISGAGKKYSDFKKLIGEVEASGCSESDKEEFLRQLYASLEEAGKEELDYLISHVPQNDGRERYKRIKKRIKQYSDIDTGKYEEIIDKYIENAERAEIDAVVKEAKNKDRRYILDAIEKLKNGGYDLGTLKEYTDELYSQVEEIDNETVRKICPDISALDVEDGIKAMEEIAAADILPRIKSNMTELIDKKLTRMKTEECEQLVEKLKKLLLGKIKDASRIYYYDARKMIKGDNTDEESLLIRTAVSKYAYALGRYEYPVMICDSSIFSNGKDGFIITPDHIFYRGFLKSGSIAVTDIDGVARENGKAGRGIYLSCRGGVKAKLPSPFDGGDEDGMARAMNEFVEYLKAKPKSRSVEYLSQEKHAAICCYRCGFVFQSGRICPKCGSRN